MRFTKYTYCTCLTRLFFFLTRAHYKRQTKPCKSDIRSTEGFG